MFGQKPSQMAAAHQDVVMRCRNTHNRFPAGKTLKPRQLALKQAARRQVAHQGGCAKLPFRGLS